MSKFQTIVQIAAQRHGGIDALEAKLVKPLPKDQIIAIEDDRWLSAMTKSIFQAGFNWKVVESMWLGFEAAFEGFDIGRCAFLNDEDFDRLVSDSRIVRYGAKIKSVQQNAVFISTISEEYGGFGTYLANVQIGHYTDLLFTLKKRGARLGGTTAQYFLRHMGVDSYVLSRDVIARLIAENIIDKAPTSQKAMRQVQEAFNLYHQQSGRSLSEISRILALSTG